MPCEIRIPAVDPSMAEARVVNWLKSPGEPVAAGEAVVEIETDKAVIEVTAEAAGFLQGPLVAEGETAAVGAVLGLIGEKSEEDIGGRRQPRPSERRVARQPAPPLPGASEQPVIPDETTRTDGNRILASPLARRLAAQAGLDLSGIRGSGPAGRIVKCDIEAASAGRSETRSALPERGRTALLVDDADSGLPAHEKIVNTAMRKAIATRLSNSSRDIPHYFLTVDCEMDRLLLLRSELNTTCGPVEKITLNDFFIRAAALALMQVPAANVAWSAEATLVFKQADVSFAVALPGGLITPVLRDAGSKSLLRIAAESRTLTSKARNGKLLPEEYKGGTFTLSNLGMFGIKNFTSIINPPQGAILSLGAVEQRPVVKNGQLDIASMMTVTFAFDHRCIDGSVGAELARAFKQLIESPLRMLLQE